MRLRRGARVLVASCAIASATCNTACQTTAIYNALQTAPPQQALGTSAIRFLTPFFPTPNLYTTPRVVPRGELVATASVEVAAEVDAARGPATERAIGEVWPFVVTGSVRFGLSDDFEAGLRSGVASGPGFYGKWVMARRGLLAALVPTTVLFLVENERHEEVVGPGIDHHLPLLVGVDVGSRVTLVATGGYSIRFQGGPPESSDTIPFGRTGVGAEVRLDEMAIHPEITALLPFWSRHPMFFAAGIGATLGGSAGARPRRARVD